RGRYKLLFVRSPVCSERIRRLDHDRSSESGEIHTHYGLARLFPSARHGHAAIRILLRPAVSADRKYAELLAARCRYVTDGDRVSVVGRARLFAEATVGASD